MATGDILSVTITDKTTAGLSTDGWYADVVVEGLNTGGTYAFGLGTNNADTANAKFVMTVVSEGYNSAGTLGTITRTVYGTRVMRKAYPDHATMWETYSGGNVTLRIALSDFVYDDDNTGAGKSGTAPTVSIGSGWYTQGGTPNNACTNLTVTNNSTTDYPKVIGHFAVEQRRPVNGTHTIEVFAVHKFGQNNCPVARVAVTATGASSSHTETGAATAMTLSARGDNIPVYAVSLNLSTGAGFTRGELVNIKFVAYPWVGDAASTLDSNADAGDKIFKLTDLNWTIMDIVYACVDGVGASPAVSTNSATAETTPYSSIANALAGIKAYNNSTHSLNRADGGVILLNAGNYSTATGSTLTNGYATVQPSSTTNRAGVVFNNTSASYQPSFFRYYNVTFTRPSNGYMVYAANTNVLVMESVNFTDTYTAWYSGDTNTNVEFLDCTYNNQLFSNGGNDGHCRLHRHCSYTPTSESTGSYLCGEASCVLGFSTTGSVRYMWRTIASAGYNNLILAYCSFLNATNAMFPVQTGIAITNMAIANCLVERVGADSTPIGEISNADVYNILLLHNTFAGQRFNHENDISAPYTNVTLINYVGRFNSLNARGNHRADVYTTTAGMTGSWPVDYSVGWSDNHNEAIAYLGDQDYWGLRSNTPTSGTQFSTAEAAGYVDDASRGGSDTGDGDYTPDTGSPLINRIVSGQSVLPFDLYGTARNNSGFGEVGAVEILDPLGNPYSYYAQL